MKKVLFVCIGNSARSQMAEGFLNTLGAAPKMLTPEMIKDADLVVTMGCGVEDACPYFNPSVMEKSVNWSLKNPKDQSIEVYGEVRDNIQGKIDELIEEMDV